MVFRVGDKVKLKEGEKTKGTVTNVGAGSGDGVDVAWETWNGKYMTSKAGALVENTGAGAFFTSAGPDMIEVLENAVVMAALTKISGPKSFWNGEVKSFIVQDLIVELGLGDMLFDNGIRVFKEPWKVAITAEQYKSYFPSEPELKSATNKWLALAVTNTLYRLFFKMGQFNSQRFMYELRVFGALVGGNILEKGISKRESGQEATYKSH